MHTPGPWKIGYHANTQDGYAKSTIRGGRFLNEVVSMKQHVGGRNFEELFANARLIAAAPALLEALEAIGEFWDFAKAEDEMSTPLSPDALIGGHSTDELLTIHEVVKAAIAAARGEVTA